MLDDLLVKTSRTFALAIPLLPEPTREAVGLAYLLFRVADTFEDASLWPRSKRLEGLERLVEVLQSSNPRPLAQALSQWSLQQPPLTHQGYLELLGVLPELMTRVVALSPDAREVVLKHAIRTSEGMAQVVTVADERGSLRLETRQALVDYCYVVAGIVGELLTELFLLGTPSLRARATELNAATRAFGQGLQLVNILKDAGDDATEGRVYLPSGLPRAEVLAMARGDLLTGDGYVQVLQQGGAPAGVVAFCALSLGLAFKALDAIEQRGPGAKVPRGEVAAYLMALTSQMESGQPIEVRR